MHTGFDKPDAAPAKVSTSSHVSVNLQTGTVNKTARTVEIPKDTAWRAPQTIVPGNTTVPDNQKQAFRVTYVDDGDTLKGVAANGSALNCRIEGINAPETTKPARPSKDGKPSQQAMPEQPGGNFAKQELLRKLNAGEITVRVTEPASKKNYDRSVCSIEVSGENVSVGMVESGAALVYDYFAKEPMLRQKLYAAQVRARDSGTGIHDPKQYPQPPENPDEYLKRMKSR